jgi:hypothetical protein
MEFIKMSLGIALIFSPLASAIAFLITYSEYLHHYPDNRQPVRMATRTAIVTFAFFIVLSVVIGFFLENMIGPQSLSM